MYFYTPQEALNTYINSFTSIFTFLGCIILVFLGITAWILSTTVIKPIETLTAKIQDVRSGHTSYNNIHLTSTRQDEIGILFQEFSGMIEQIHENIEEKLHHELQEKIYQQKILYAQINPHFLYNTLSSINSRAIIADQAEISHMLILLSTFYRTALNQGKDMTTLDNELCNIQAYIQLQLLSYSTAPKIIYDFDKTISDAVLPNFILQPLVENALEHGLKKSSRQDKMLRISTHKEKTESNQYYVIIQIQDNGQGMDSNTFDAILNASNNGYGVNNVKDRLHLLYADNFHFALESQPECGTTVTIRLPYTPTVIFNNHSDEI